MPEESAQEKSNTPPYLSWPTFSGFIGKLKNTVVPNRIDPTLLTNLSGTTQGQLLGALKFLRLTNGNGGVTERLKDLVRTYGTVDWAGVLAETIESSYKPIIGSLDLNSATSGELKEQFRKVGGIEGDTIERAMRFYLNALKNAGISYSPHLKIRQRALRGSGIRKRGKGALSNTADEGDDDETYDEPETLGGTIKLPFPLPNKPLTTIILAQGISEAEWSMIDMYVRNYIKISAEQS